MSSNIPYIPNYLTPPWDLKECDLVTWKFRDTNGNVISFDIFYHEDTPIEIYLGEREVTVAVRKWWPDLYSEIENRIFPDEG
jgi:hypothetical protein